MPRNRSILLPAFLLVAFLSACRDGHDEPVATAEPPVADVAVEEARRTVVPDAFEAVGTVRPRTRSVLSSKATGEVIALHVREGQAVERGETLVEIDDRDLRAGLARAEAGHGVARATWERYRALLGRRSVSRQEYEEVEARFRAAEADLEAARAALTWARIVSPVDGVVTAKHVDAGALAAPGAPLLTVESADSFRLEALVPESRLDAVATGASATVRVDAIGEDFGATVAEIVPAADVASRTFLVKLDLPPDPRLRSGMFGRVRFGSGTLEVLTVPAAALVERGALLAVYVLDETGTARFRLVTRGRSHGDRVEILSGLDAGERIVAADPGRVRDGSPVVSETAALEGR